MKNVTAPQHEDLDQIHAQQSCSQQANVITLCTCWKDNWKLLVLLVIQQLKWTLINAKKIVSTKLPFQTLINRSDNFEWSNRPFAVRGHVTTPTLNSLVITKWRSEMERVVEG